MSSIYDKLPYGEVQSEMSSAAFERLQLLMTKADCEPVDDEVAVETIKSVAMSDGGLSLDIQSQLEVFVPIFSNIGQVLVEHDRLPDYLLDTLSKLAEVVDSRRIGAVVDTNQMSVPPEAIKQIAAERWYTYEKERLTGETFDMVSVFIPGIGPVTVRMQYVADTERWKLGYFYAESREYEYCGGRLYRVVGKTLFTDPVGTEEEQPNIIDGEYLPSRLNLASLQERAAA